MPMNEEDENEMNYTEPDVVGVSCQQFVAQGVVLKNKGFQAIKNFRTCYRPH